MLQHRFNLLARAAKIASVRTGFMDYNNWRLVRVNGTDTMAYTTNVKDLNSFERRILAGILSESHNVVVDLSNCKDYFHITNSQFKLPTNSSY